MGGRGREEEREGKKLQPERETLINCLSYTTHNPDMYPEWESNWLHFALWDDTQQTEPHQSGLGQILSVVELSNEICEVVPKLILSVITNSISYKFFLKCLKLVLLLIGMVTTEFLIQTR